MVRPRAEAVWVYDVPMFCHSNQTVRQTVSKLVQLLCQVVGNSSDGELKVSKKVTVGKSCEL